MNRKNLFLSILFLLYGKSYAQTDEQLVARAHDFFLQAKYEKACSDYEKIKNKNFEVLYNLSLSYAYQGKIAQALLTCRRAERIANFIQLTQLYELINFFEQQKNPDLEKGWAEFIELFIKKCILSLSILLIQVLMLLFLFFLLWVWWYRYSWLISRYFLSLYIGLCLLFGLIWYAKVSFLENKIGVVIKNNAPLYAGPDDTFYKKSELHEADEIVMLSKKNRYYHVQEKKLVGWMYEDDIQFV